MNRNVTLLTEWHNDMKRVITLLTATLPAMFGASMNAPAWGQTPAAAAQAQPPAWAAKGAYVFRVSTPDETDVLPQLEQGHAITAGLLDGIPQITDVNGLIGHDHPGPWNWDGLWPYWNRATFRAALPRGVGDGGVQVNPSRAAERYPDLSPPSALVREIKMKHTFSDEEDVE